MRSYLAFSDRLKTDPYLYSLRGALHAALHQTMIGQCDLKRHKHGIWSWLAWALTAPAYPTPHDSGKLAKAPPVACYDFFALEMRDAHWGSLLPIARDFQSAGQCVRIWTRGASAGQTGLEGLPNVQIRTLDKCVSRQRTSPILVARIAMRTSALARDLGLGWSDTDTSKIAQVFWDFESSKAVWERLLASGPSKACFLTSEGPSLIKGMVQAFRSSGARVFHVCHGLPWEYHANSNATGIIPFSRSDASWFRDRVAGDVAILDCGNPRVNQIHQDFQTARHAFSSGLPLRILFLSNGVEDCYTTEHELQDLRILLLPELQRNRTVLRVRPHPRENRELLARAIARAGLQVDSISGESLADDLEWADVCATPWSTSLLEAMVAGRACFWTNARNDRLCLTGDYIDAGLGTVVSDSSAWTAIVSRLLEGPQGFGSFILSEDRLRQSGLIALSDGKHWFERLGSATS